MSGLYPAQRPTAADKAELAEKSAYEIHKERSFQVKEYLIAVEQVKIMQEKLKVCYIKSGPNHFEDCKELREELWEKINTPNYGAPGPPRSVRAKPPPPWFPFPRARAHVSLCVPAIHIECVSRVLALSRCRRLPSTTSTRERCRTKIIRMAFPAVARFVVLPPGGRKNGCCSRNRRHTYVRRDPHGIARHTHAAASCESEQLNNFEVSLRPEYWMRL